MFAKKLVPLIALILVALFLLPGYVSAADPLTSITTIIDVPSEHQDSYDTVLNVANSSIITNKDTWDPVPSGVYVGSSTPESSFKFNEYFAATNGVLISWEFKLEASQVMEGVGQWTMRLPFSMTDVHEWFFELYELSSSGCYQIVGTPPTLQFNSSTYLVAAPFDIYGNSSIYMDGDNFWTTGDRGYYSISAPLNSGVLYLLVFHVEYILNGRCIVYLSPNDVCSDGIRASNFTRYYRISPVSYVMNTDAVAVDCGVSFDMRIGMGNNGIIVEKYLPAGDTVSIIGYSNIGGTNNYHVLMIPFWTANGSARFSVDVQQSGLSIWTVADTTYWNYLQASSAGLIVTPNTIHDHYFTITLQSSWDQTVRFLLMDPPHVNDSDSADYLARQLVFAGLNVTSNQTAWCQIGDEEYFFNLYAPYQLSTYPVVAPDVNMQFPWPQNFALPQYSNWDLLCITLINIGVYLFFPPVILYDLYYGNTVGERIYNALNAFGQYVGWRIHNAIDAIFDAFKLIGQWLYSIGEAIWNAITVIVSTIMEFGAILLGLLAILVIIIIFFFAIWFQLKIYSIFLRLAQGDTRGALKEGQELASTIESGVGKVV